MSVQPSNRYKPNFDHLAETLNKKTGRQQRITNVENKLPQAVQETLSHGAGFAGGQSGTTNLVLHFVAEANSYGENIEPKEVLRALVMFTGYDSGHLADECLGVAKQLDGVGPGKLNLNLGLSDPSDASTPYITSLKKLFAGTDSASGADSLKGESRMALLKTIQYFEEHSYYAKK